MILVFITDVTQERVLKHQNFKVMCFGKNKRHSITSNAEMSFLNPQEIVSVCSKPRKDEPKRHYEP
jgi:hypothetical protein